MQARVKARWKDGVTAIGEIAKLERACACGSHLRRRDESGVEGPALEHGDAVGGGESGDVERAGHRGRCRVARGVDGGWRFNSKRLNIVRTWSRSTVARRSLSVPGPIPIRSSLRGLLTQHCIPLSPPPLPSRTCISYSPSLPSTDDNAIPHAIIPSASNFFRTKSSVRFMQSSQRTWYLSRSGAGA